MTWLEKKAHWLPERKDSPGRPDPRPVEQSYSVVEAAKLLSVHPNTMYKYLAILPDAGWYKLPGGDIRIKESALRKLQENAGRSDINLT